MTNHHKRVLSDVEDSLNFFRPRRLVDLVAALLLYVSGQNQDLSSKALDSINVITSVFYCSWKSVPLDLVPTLSLSAGGTSLSL